MNVENEYWIIKEELKNEIKTFKHFKYDLDISKMSEEQLDARNRGLKSSEESVNETCEILDEIKTELYDFIRFGGEVSEKTIIELVNDLQYDLLFNADNDDQDAVELNAKIKYLNSL